MGSYDVPRTNPSNRLGKGTTMSKSRAKKNKKAAPKKPVTKRKPAKKARANKPARKTVAKRKPAKKTRAKKNPTVTKGTGRVLQTDGHTKAEARALFGQRRTARAKHKRMPKRLKGSTLTYKSASLVLSGRAGSARAVVDPMAALVDNLRTMVGANDTTPSRQAAEEAA